MSVGSEPTNGAADGGGTGNGDGAPVGTGTGDGDPVGSVPLKPEVVDQPVGVPAEGPTETPDGEAGEAVERPAKVLRIGSMVKQLLEEVRQAPLDEASRSRLRDIYERSIRELEEALSPDLAAELDRISVLFDSETPSEPELRVAQAQLVGWLEGLFHGIQATLVAQQVAARAQLDEMRQRSLPPGPEGGMGRPGAYL